MQIPYAYFETAVCVECCSSIFTVKGSVAKHLGWRALEDSYRSNLKKETEQDKDSEDKALPELTEGQELLVSDAIVKEGKTSPPKHFTE